MRNKHYQPWSILSKHHHLPNLFMIDTEVSRRSWVYLSSFAYYCLTMTSLKHWFLLYTDKSTAGTLFSYLSNTVNFDKSSGLRSFNTCWINLLHIWLLLKTISLNITWYESLCSLLESKITAFSGVQWRSNILLHLKTKIFTSLSTRDLESKFLLVWAFISISK